MDNGNRPIDWHYWRNLREVELWQASLLSLNINPDTVQHDPDGWVTGPHNAPYLLEESFPSAQLHDSYRKRLNLLKSNLLDQTHFTGGIVRQTAPYKSTVKLSEFAAWLELLGVPIPPELQEIAAAPLQPSKGGVEDEKPLSTRERNTLLTIIAALCKEAGVDCARPAKAAGQIKNMASLMGIEIGETTIEEHLKKIPDAVATRMR
jgi:hypothetical protein